MEPRLRLELRTPSFAYTSFSGNMYKRARLYLKHIAQNDVASLVSRSGLCFLAIATVLS